MATATVKPKATQGRGALIAACATLVVACGLMVYWLRQPTEADAANTRVFISAKTNRSFPHFLAAGETFPIMAPDDAPGQPSGWPAEACYWQRVMDSQGHATYKYKAKPTYVLLNLYKDRDDQTPTLCPDCGREVVPHNAAVNMPPPELRGDAAPDAKGP